MAETFGHDPRRYRLHDFLPALKAGVLVGGQAVNHWAEVYLKIALEVLRSRNARHFDALWGAQWSDVIPWSALTATNDLALSRFAQHQQPA